MRTSDELMRQGNDVWRGRLLSALSSYADRWPQELQTIDRFSKFVEGEPDCFERSTIHGHITAAAWLVDPTSELVLLTHHRKLNKWLQLGGHADGDGDTIRVALTEAVEESGIAAIQLVSDDIFDLDIHPIPARGADPEHFHYDVRYAIRAEDTAFTVSEESHDLSWVSINAIHDYTTEPSMMRMAEKWLGRR